MRIILFLVCLFILSLPGSVAGQTRPDTLEVVSPDGTQLAVFDTERTHLDQRGLAVLGGWAVGNLIIDGAALSKADGSARYFHQMNIGWGAVNLAIAGTGYLAARKASRTPLPDRAGNVRKQLRTENLYLFNAGLDVAYLATGVYLLEKSRNPAAPGSPDRWRGYGQSLLMQGGFLLLFDGFQYATHHRHGRALYPLLSQVTIGPGSIAFTLPVGATTRPIKPVHFPE